MKKGRTSVYMRSILLEVVIPQGLQWKFMEAFGEEFKLQDFQAGGYILRSVHKYHEHPNGWHIQVIVSDGAEEAKFYNFLRQFSLANEVSFREPKRSGLAEEVIRAVLVSVNGLFDYLPGQFAMSLEQILAAGIALREFSSCDLSVFSGVASVGYYILQFQVPTSQGEPWVKVFYSPDGKQKADEAVAFSQTVNEAIYTALAASFSVG